MTIPQTIVTKEFTISYFVKRHPEKKQTEDSIGIFLLDDGTVVCSVADGMGGHRAGDKASRIAIESLDENLKLQQYTKMKRIVKGFEDANDKVLALACGAGSTLTTFTAKDSQVRFYNSGDSAGSILGYRGKAKYQSVPHSPLGLGIESGLIDDSQGVPEDLRYVVTNYIGSPHLRIEIGRLIQLDKLDRILLYSDGFSDNFTLDQLPISLRPVDICAYIAEHYHSFMSSKDGKFDDLSFILMSKNDSEES